MKTYRWNQQTLACRHATRSELELAVEWAAAEGWNPGLEDADIFWQTDPEGFVCVELAGKPVAVGSIVSYGDFGFMGFFIVRQDLRQQGIGAPFWHWRRDQLLARLNAGASIGMDGVLDMRPFYARGGFVESHRSTRMVCQGQKRPAAKHIVELSDQWFAEVQRVDQRCFGFDRSEFLRRWVQPANGVALGTQRDGKLSGYGVIRKCLEGFKVGPLFADNPEDAQDIYCALANHAEGEAVFLDVSENNHSALKLAKDFNMQEVFACGRMYHGSAPQLPWREIYGITSFELG